VQVERVTAIDLGDREDRLGEAAAEVVEALVGDVDVGLSVGEDLQEIELLLGFRMRRERSTAKVAKVAKVRREFSTPSLLGVLGALAVQIPDQINLQGWAARAHARDSLLSDPRPYSDS
jgi:hypothetical protein